MFIIGIMISVVISVYAATVISAGEVSFNGSTSNIKYNGTTAANVEDAINGVYSSANTIASKVGSATLTTSAQNLSSAVNELNARYILINGSGGYSSTTTINAIRTKYNSLGGGAYIGYLLSGDISFLLILKADNSYGVIYRFSYSGSASSKPSVSSMQVYGGTWGSWVAADL